MSTAVDRGVHEQVIPVGELARHTNRSVRDGGRERRQGRHEQPDRQIERAVVEAEHELGVGLRRERDPPGACHRKARRRGIHFSAELVAAKGQRAGDLPDTLGLHDEIVDSKLHVVLRLVEGSVARGREVDRAVWRAAADS